MFSPNRLSFIRLGQVGFGLILAGCAPVPSKDAAYGVLFEPLCLVWCTVHTGKSEAYSLGGGSASGGDVSSSSSASHSSQEGN